MTGRESKPRVKAHRLVDRLAWTETDAHDSDLPGVLAVRGPREGDEDVSLESVIGVGSAEVIARVSHVPPADDRDDDADSDTDAATTDESP